MFSDAKAKAKATRGSLAKAKPQGEKATAFSTSIKNIHYINKNRSL